MQEQTEAPNTNVDSETRRALKRVARRLFAERGIRPVSVREIAREAGQRNQGAVAYHFGTKEALVVELLTEGAERIESRRRAMLDAMEAQGGPATLEEAVTAIVMPSASFSDEDAEYGSHFNRFLLQLDAADPRFVDRHLEGRWSVGYQRCLDHLRRLMPGLNRADQNRRLLFLGAYVSGLLAKREEMMADADHAHPTWRAPATLADIIRTGSALLQA